MCLSGPRVAAETYLGAKLGCTQPSAVSPAFETRDTRRLNSPFSFRNDARDSIEAEGLAQRISKPLGLLRGRLRSLVRLCKLEALMSYGVPIRNLTWSSQQAQRRADSLICPNLQRRHRAISL